MVNLDEQIYSYFPDHIFHDQKLLNLTNQTKLLQEHGIPKVNQSIEF